MAAQAVLFLCMNTAGIFISYLSDRAQRQAFLETRRCIEARLRLETENQRQVRPPHVVAVLNSKLKMYILLLYYIFTIFFMS